jgi:hypothetical protein
MTVAVWVIFLQYFRNICDKFFLRFSHVATPPGPQGAKIEKSRVLSRSVTDRPALAQTGTLGLINDFGQKTKTATVHGGPPGYDF